MGVSSEPLSKERIFVPLTDKENRISLSVIPPVSRYSYFLAENASLLYIHILQKPFTMSGRQAKTLSSADLSDLLVFASCTRNPLRNRVIVLLSTKAGMRAGEIANLTWDMVLGPPARSAASSSCATTQPKKAVAA
jgi:integrase